MGHGEREVGFDCMKLYYFATDLPTYNTYLGLVTKKECIGYKVRSTAVTPCAFAKITFQYILQILTMGISSTPNIMSYGVNISF